MSFDNEFWGDKDTPNHSQWRIDAERILSDRDIWHPTATKYFPLGAIAVARDGRKWRYCEEGGNGLSKAMINAGAAQTDNWTYIAQTNSPDVPAVGDKIVTVTLTSTAVAGAFIDGYLFCPDGTGEGEMYLIKNNKAGTTNTGGGYDIVCEIADTGGIRTALLAASDLSVTANLYKDVVVMPTTPVMPCVGVNNVAVTADYFFWSQVKGPCAVLGCGTDTIVIGDEVAAAAQTEGAACLPDNLQDDNTGDTIIGYVMKAPAATSDYCIVDLTIEI